MSLSVEKCNVMSLGVQGTSWKIGTHSNEEVVADKYLGINISLRARNMIARREDRMVAAARAYTYQILALSREKLDRAYVKRQLWISCALPAILNGSGAYLVTAGTMDKIQLYQNMVAKFICQVPVSTSNAVVAIYAGLLPI